VSIKLVRGLYQILARSPSVHGEYQFSSLPMPPPPHLKATGTRLSGNDMSSYMRNFTEAFLKDKIRYNTTVLKIRRPDRADRGGWIITVCDPHNTQAELHFDKVVLCTGVSGV
jgi:cation diffusion facilitator CzcD-associated flavoprotein CzcO